MIELCRNQVMTAEVLSYHLLPCKIEIELETPSKRNMFIEIYQMKIEFYPVFISVQIDTANIIICTGLQECNVCKIDLDKL